MRQADLFSAGRPAPAPQPEIPAPDAIRLRLLAVLAEAQEASKMPWEPPYDRTQEIVFHNMANWLPEVERDELRQAFATEMARLRSTRPVC